MRARRRDSCERKKCSSLGVPQALPKKRGQQSEEQRRITLREESRIKRFVPTAQIQNMTEDEWATINVPSPMDAFYVSQLTDAHVMQLRAAFDRFDENGDGVISQKEMETVFENLGSSMSVEDVERVIRSMDADQDGMVGWPEYLRAMARQLLVFEGQAEVDLAMDLFRGVSITDAREGGGPPEIPVDEIRRLMTTAGSEPLSEEELNELLRLADPEGLGMVPLDRWTQLECWKLPAEPPDGTAGEVGLGGRPLGGENLSV